MMLSTLYTTILLLACTAVAAPAPKPLVMPPLLDRASLPEPRDSGPQTKAADGTYEHTVLKHHNIHRDNATVGPLSWDPQLVQDAKVLAEKCVFEHDTSIGGGGYGQNIAAGLMASDISAIITDQWYNNEVIHYLNKWYGSEPDLNTFADYGHYTQVVWKGSERVGCYTHHCTGKGGIKGLSGIPPFFTVCNYAPAGNWIGEFGANVLKPKGLRSIGPNFGAH